MSDDQKEEKPKKLFVVIHTAWDDGEVDTEMYEFRKNKSGRGAPGKWRLNAKEFNSRVEDLLCNPSDLKEDMEANMQLGESSGPTMPATAPVTPKKVKKQSDSADGAGFDDIKFEDT